MDTFWVAYYRFASVIGCPQQASLLTRLGIMERIAASCGFWYPRDGICIVSDRFASVTWDAERNRRGMPFRLHCETGPAIAFRDGWELHYWHGQRVPRDWIENRSSLDPAIALTWKNIEQRRAACEILGWSAILDALSARTIDTDADPEIGSLVEVTIPDIGRERFLRVRCGTGRDFVLPVPPDMDTALNAQAWTYGIEGKDFVRPEIRT